MEHQRHYLTTAQVLFESSAALLVARSVAHLEAVQLTDLSFLIQHVGFVLRRAREKECAARGVFGKLCALRRV